MAVKNINFLLKEHAPANEFIVEGTVYADLNGNGKFDANDAVAPNVFVYQDVNRNGIADTGEQRVLTDSTGKYTLTIPANHADTYAVGVIPPTSEWLFTDPGHDGVEDVFAGPGSPAQHVNFFLDPPDSAFPPGGEGLGNIIGYVFNDLDGDGVHDPGENGVPNFRVFIDTNVNGVWDSATEASALTISNGSFSFADVPPGLIRLDIVIPNEGTPAADWSLTTPALGYREVALGEGGSITGLTFGLDNRADNDWGDLPNTLSHHLGRQWTKSLRYAGLPFGNQRRRRSGRHPNANCHRRRFGRRQRRRRRRRQQRRHPEAGCQHAAGHRGRRRRLAHRLDGFQRRRPFRRERTVDLDVWPATISAARPISILERGICRSRFPRLPSMAHSPRGSAGVSRA